MYTKKGLDDNSYVVYTKGSFICKGIDTPAPSLWSSYIVKDSDGNYKILGDLEQNTKVSNYMDSLKSDADVQALTAEVQAAYEEAQKNDAALAQFLDGLGEEADSSGTSADGTMLTVTEGCNVRDAASSDGDIIGGLDEGDQVQKLGQEGDWIQIEYDGQTGYVYSGLLQ
ncbi:SH3 domain-containing protein [Blautia sp. MSJ-19]|nr:SH3 domain-containing protein [Blautia sp. MSJ-19]